MRHVWICFLLLQAHIVSAQWVENTLINTPICTQFGKQNDVRLDGNGQHGAFLVWKDERVNNNNPDIYIQQLDANGYPLWNADGVVLCDDTSDQSTPNLCTDLNGGVIVAWSDRRNNGERDIYAQRVNANGQVQWTTNGVPIASKPIREHNEKIASDDNGGAYIFWEQYDSLLGYWDIWGQHIDANGQRLWDFNGIPAVTLGSSTIPGDKLNVKLQKDGQGGVYVVWQDLRNIWDHDIFAQHFNASGDRLWSQYGVVVCSAVGTQNNPKIDPDSVHNGVYIAWADDRGGMGYDIYAQSLNFDGMPQWSLNGLPVCEAAGNQSAVDIVSTTSIAGLVLTWKDSRNGLTDIYAQKMDPNGNAVWSANGVAVSVSPYAQINPNICSDGNGGVIIAWQDSTINDWDVKSQRLDAAGNALWDWNGVVVSQAVEIQSHPKNIPDGNGGSIYAWQDKRANQYDIYAHHLNKDGVFTDIRNRSGVGPQCFPNPFIDCFQIDAASPILGLECYNLLGELIFSQGALAQPSYRVNTQAWPAGSYVWVIQTAEGVQRKIVVKG